MPIWRWRFVENGAHSLAIEPQTESILRCKLRNLCLPIFLIQWPKAFQVLIVNRAVPPLLAMHPLFDLSRQRFHCFAFHLEVDCSKSAQNEESSSRGAFKSGLASVDSGLQVNLEIALSGASAKVKPPSRAFQPGRKCVETSDDVIEDDFIRTPPAVYGTLVLCLQEPQRMTFTKCTRAKTNAAPI